MQKLKVAASALLKDKLQVEREVVCLSNADLLKSPLLLSTLKTIGKAG